MPNWKIQGETIGVFTRMNIQIAIQMMKVSSVWKTSDEPKNYNLDFTVGRAMDKILYDEIMVKYMELTLFTI